MIPACHISGDLDSISRRSHLRILAATSRHLPLIPLALLMAAVEEEPAVKAPKPDAKGKIHFSSQLRQRTTNDLLVIKQILVLQVAISIGGHG